MNDHFLRKIKKPLSRAAIILFLVCSFGLLLAPGVNAQDGGTTYVVQPGDNLFRISLRFGTTVQALAAANNLPNPNLIYVGQVLTIPDGASAPPPADPGDPAPPPSEPPPTSGQSYTVVRGDTLYAIARRFNSSVSAIAAANSLANPNLIFVGQVLTIPGSSGGDGGSTPPPDDGGSDAPPVVTPGAGGGFELGGHIANYDHTPQMQTARMTWIKVQIRWNRGEGTGPAAAAITRAHNSGFKILLGIVGVKDQMGDPSQYEQYFNEFAAYLGEVAALGPDAIEVWNEPNIDREWPTGQVNGATYTRMLAKAYNAIKSRNANVMVISGAPAPTGFFGGGCAAGGCDDNVFLAQMRDAGAAQYLDCVGAHYNEGIISPDLRSGDPRGGHYTRYFWGMLDLYYNTFGGQRRVCWTELGYLSPEGYGSLPAGFTWASDTSVAEHAEWLGRAAALSRGSGRVRLMIVWNVNFREFGADPQGGYAIVRPDGSCPACGTLAGAMQ